VYDGWNLIHERVAHTNGTVDEIEYVWGLDLSGSLQGAGGVGGLLYEKRNGNIFIPCYDANGNITAYVETNGTVRAYRQFDAFGNTIAKGGDMVDIFHFWFSTKYLDHDTGLYYYGYRYYSPMLQRWINRDPIGESGGVNLYGFVGNEVLSQIDFLGLVKKEDADVWNCKSGLCEVESNKGAQKIDLYVKYEGKTLKLDGVKFITKIAESLKFSHNNIMESGFYILENGDFSSLRYNEELLKQVAELRIKMGSKFKDRQKEFKRLVNGMFGNTATPMGIKNSTNYPRDAISHYHSHPHDFGNEIGNSATDSNNLLGMNLAAFQLGRDVKGNSIRTAYVSKPRESKCAELYIYGNTGSGIPLKPINVTIKYMD
jgi:RHS repeat-associated protein